MSLLEKMNLIISHCYTFLHNEAEIPWNLLKIRKTTNHRKKYVVSLIQILTSISFPMCSNKKKRKKTP